MRLTPITVLMSPLLLATADVTELSPSHLVALGSARPGPPTAPASPIPSSAACLSAYDGSVIVWQNDSHLVSRNRRRQITLSYHPHFTAHHKAEGHAEYFPLRDGRMVLLRTAPAHATAPPAHARWRDELDGAVIAGTFTLGTGTTASRPHFDQVALSAFSLAPHQSRAALASSRLLPVGKPRARSLTPLPQYASIWHGVLEPLLDLWRHLQTLRPPATRSGRLNCPRYHTIITDEVLGPRHEWKNGYLLPFWRR